MAWPIEEEPEVEVECEGEEELSSLPPDIVYFYKPEGAGLWNFNCYVKLRKINSSELKSTLGKD